MHKAFFDSMLNDLVVDKKNPLHVTRFEDLISQPVTELEQMFKFLLDIEDIEGTNVQRIIRKVTANKDAGKVYELKASTKVANSQAKRYTEAQLIKIKEDLKDMMHFFGYANEFEGQ
jgi:hypothetical protein